jgi:hypothetical protein
MAEQKNRECENVREALQSHLDSNESLPAHLLDHLNACPSCRSFSEALLGLSERLRSALDSAVKVQGPPDFSFLERKRNSERKINRKPLVWAAAAMVLALASIFGYFGYKTYRSNNLIREDNHLFVQSIIEGSLFDAGLEGNRYAYNNRASRASTWFQESELSIELLGNFPLFSD